MRNVRVFYRKKGRMKFISHLDMTRFMSRLITRAKLPIWYTEGFNQHVYMNFAVPLSLGYEGLYEILEIRLIDENFTCEDCLKALQSAAIPDIEFFAVKESGLNMKEIGFAEYSLEFDTLPPDIEKFLNQDSIICLKKGKKGKFKEIDIIPKIRSYEIKDKTLKLCLVAGTEDNLNPSLVLSAYYEKSSVEPISCSITRTSILDKNGNLFE